MANKIFNDFQGNTVRVDGICYTFIGETTSGVDTTPAEIQGAYGSCLECNVDSSSESSSSSFDPQSESSSSSGGGGGGATKSFLGADFSNGESKVVCPSQFSRYTSATPDYRFAAWQHEYASLDYLFLDGRDGANCSSGNVYPNGQNKVRIDYNNKQHTLNFRANASETIATPTTTCPTVPRPFAVASSAKYTKLLASHNIANPSAWTDAVSYKFNPQQFGQVTTTTGVTIKWEPIASTAPADWGSKFTAGDYVATTGGENTIKCQPADPHDDKPRMRVTISWT